MSEQGQSGAIAELATPAPRLVRTHDALLLAAGLAGTGYALWLMFADPLSGGRVAAHFILVPALVVAWQRIFVLARRHSVRRGKAPAKGGGCLALLGGLALAVICSTLAEVAVEEWGRSVVSSDLAPVVAALDGELRAKGRLPDDVLPALASATRVRRVVYLRKDAAYVLTTHGGSIDMDGSTIYFNSRDHQWRQYHNDLEETADDALALRAAAKDMELGACYQRDSSGWGRCQ